VETAGEGAAGLAQLAGEVRPQMHNGHYPAVQQRLLGFAEVALEDRLKVTRLLEPAREAGRFGAGQLNHQRDGHVFRIQRDAVAKDEQ